MNSIRCDECGVIGTCYSTLCPPQKLMNEHMEIVHKGQPFGYSIYKD